MGTLRSRKVHFTRYELLKILRWTTEGRSYSRLQNALDRLSGVRIKGESGGLIECEANFMLVESMIDMKPEIVLEPKACPCIVLPLLFASCFLLCDSTHRTG